MAARTRDRTPNGPKGDAPVEYQIESFTAEEGARLSAHFTNLDRPAFALVNLLRR